MNQTAIILYLTVCIAEPPLGSGMIIGVRHSIKVSVKRMPNILLNSGSSVD